VNLGAGTEKKAYCTAAEAGGMDSTVAYATYAVGSRAVVRSVAGHDGAHMGCSGRAIVSVATEHNTGIDALFAQCNAYGI
jgi:hypothetical protein